MIVGLRSSKSSSKRDSTSSGDAAISGGRRASRYERNDEGTKAIVASAGPSGNVPLVCNEPVPLERGTSTVAILSAEELGERIDPRGEPSRAFDGFLDVHERTRGNGFR